MEQKHISNTRVETTDFEMYIPCDIKPNDIAVVKLLKSNVPREDPKEQEETNTSLNIVGFSQEDDVIFEFKNVKEALI